MNNIIKAQLVITGLIVGTHASAAEFSVEGKVTALSRSSMVCNGVPIELDANTLYSTPSFDKGKIALETLLSTKEFPQKKSEDTAQPAILGGTCIVEGTDDTTITTSGTAGRRVAASVFLEVAEHVLVGPKTSPVAATNAAPGTTPFKIMGVEIVMLQNTDSSKPGFEEAGRIVASKPTNGFGYDVNLDTVPLGDDASAEGYMGTDGKFYAFKIETTGGDALNNPDSPDATVQRGDLTLAKPTIFKMEIRGGCTFMPPLDANGKIPRDANGKVVFPSARSHQLFVSVDNGETLTTPKDAIWVNPSSIRTPIVNGTTNVNCGEDITTRNADTGFSSGTYRYRNDNYTGWSVAPTRVRVRVVPTAAFPTTQYGPEIFMTRVK